jgi:hypothetical protein
MTTNTSDSRSALELSFELKYCERCGGLWLRPVGGGQIYCVACAIAMGELPPVSCGDGVRGPTMPKGPQRATHEIVAKSCERYGDVDRDAWGGVA